MNVTVVAADASAGLTVDGPFDVIVLSGSVAEVPRALLSQLKPGGRLTAVVGQLPIMRAVLMTRGQDAGHASIELFDTVAPRLVGFGEPSRSSSEPAGRSADGAVRRRDSSPRRCRRSSSHRSRALVPSDL